MADITRPEDRARGMGLVGAAFGLGFVVGPFVGGELSPVTLSLPLGLAVRAGTAPFFLAALLSAANWILAFRLLPESLPRDGTGTVRAIRVFDWTRLSGNCAAPRSPACWASPSSSTVAFSMMEQTLILFGERRVSMDAVGAGRLLGFVGVLMVVVQGGLVGRMARRFGEERLLVAGTVILVPGLLLLALSHGWGLLLAAMVPLALGSGLLHPSLHALLSRRAPRDEQGGMLGLNQSLSSLARVLGPSAGGWLFQSRGVASPYWVGAGLLVVAAVWATRAVRKDEIPRELEAGSRS